jgi:hypothetical protein
MLESEKNKLQHENVQLGIIHSQIDRISSETALQHERLSSTSLYSQEEEEQALADLNEKKCKLYKQQEEMKQGMDFRTEFINSFENYLTIKRHGNSSTLFYYGEYSRVLFNLLFI